MASTPVTQTTLLSAVTTVSTGATVVDTALIDNGERNFLADISGTGAVSATVVVQVSNSKRSTAWITLGTITLSGTTSAADGFVSDDSWQYVRGQVTAISGTGAAVTLVMGA